MIKTIHIVIIFLISIASVFAGEGYYKCKTQNSIHLTECCKKKLASCCPKIGKNKSATEYKKDCCTFEELSDVEDFIVATQQSQKGSKSNNILYYNLYSGVTPFKSIRKQQYYLSSRCILHPHSKKYLYKSLCLYLC